MIRKPHLLALMALVLFAFQLARTFPSLNFLLHFGNGKLQVGVAIALLAAFGWTQWVGLLRPFGKIRKTMFGAFEDVGDEILQTGRRRGIELRVRVSVLSRRVFVKAAPGEWSLGGWVPFGRTYSTRWSTRNARFLAGRHLQLRPFQGLEGKAYEKKRIVLTDFQQGNPQRDYALTRDQYEAVKSIKFALACPIFKLDKDGVDVSSKVVGMVVVDSEREWSPDLTDPVSEAALSPLVADVERLAMLCSRIHYVGAL